MKGEYNMNYIVKNDPMKLSEESVRKTNLIGEVGNYTEKELLEALKNVTNEELLRLPKLIKDLNRSAFFPSSDGIVHNSFASKNPGTHFNYRQWAKSAFYDDLTTGYLTMAYLEILGHRPDSKEAFVEKADALALYNGLREVVLTHAEEMGYQNTKKI